MQTDYTAVLQWIYLFNSIALIQLAFRQVMKRRKGRELDLKIKAAALAQWAGTSPDALMRQLGAASNQGDLDHGKSAYTWRGERQLLEAFYQDGNCTGVELRQHEGDAFPTLNTYFNCAVLAALACSWKFLAAQAGMQDAGEALPVSAAAKQYLLNFVLFFAGAWLASFALKRHQLLLSGGCIVMVALALPLLGWP
ncbi:hypothetical protein Herbaro_17640 [Herbaspirillum sp. WKF16]|uniref:hypothetical protein n=1 Tax=Herbaspirillum sp. WKF16 TaxID=3028312 RepID=UPI0023A98252|nr:hypothetical protein [Herbaspirillum sp. WKF16]WDZ95294.1 hypothetical protein Herbaro_17640 [Herbaspirillum sp. WKF16]